MRARGRIVGGPNDDDEHEEVESTFVWVISGCDANAIRKSECNGEIGSLSNAGVLVDMHNDPVLPG